MDVFSVKGKGNRKRLPVFYNSINAYLEEMEIAMAEIWDVYDENANRTGRVMERGVPRSGDYMLCVHIYLYTPDGKFLVQKRAMNKESHPGEWDVTGGAVLSGEESIDGAIRETQEELGIKLDKSELFFAGRLKKKKNFTDIYFVKKNFDLNDCLLQKEEVEEGKLVGYDEMIELALNSRRRDQEYIGILKGAVKKIQENGI